MRIEIAAYILSGIFLIGGGLAFMASVANWDWFFKADGVRMLTGRLARLWQRIVYAIIGIAIIAMATHIFTHASVAV